MFAQTRDLSVNGTRDDFADLLGGFFDDGLDDVVNNRHESLGERLTQVMFQATIGMQLELLHGLIEHSMAHLFKLGHDLRVELLAHIGNGSLRRRWRRGRICESGNGRKCESGCGRW